MPDSKGKYSAVIVKVSLKRGVLHYKPDNNAMIILKRIYLKIDNKIKTEYIKSRFTFFNQIIDVESELLIERKYDEYIKQGNQHT